MGPGRAFRARARVSGRTVAVLSSLLLTGCPVAVPPVKVRTVVNHLDRDGFFCFASLDRSGLGSAPRPTGDEVLVGYDNHFDRGSDPLPCNRSKDFVARAFVQFEGRDALLSSGPPTAFALRFTRRATDLPLIPSPSGAGSCTIGIFAQDSDFEPGFAETFSHIGPFESVATISRTPAETAIATFRNSADPADASVDVSGAAVDQLVRRWIADPASNHGIRVEVVAPATELSATDRTSSCTAFYAVDLVVTLPDS
jgi:hypothetical protein